MPTTLTGIQTVALNQIIRFSGLTAPNVSDKLAAYHTYAAVQPYYYVCQHITGITSAVQAATFVGDGINKVYTPSYSILPPAWTKSHMLQVQVGSVVLNDTAYSFSEDFLTITFTNAPTGTITLNWLPRQIFYSLGEDFPALVGSIPEPFSANLGMGVLFETALARTQNMFPNGLGGQIFISYLAQARGYSLYSQQVIDSSAQSGFGSENSPAATATGGFSHLCGNSKYGFSVVGTALNNSGYLLDLKNIYASFSALGLLNYLLTNNTDYVGNVRSKVIGKVFTDPATGKIAILDAATIASLVIGLNSPLRDTVTDQAVVAIIDAVLDSDDVSILADYMGAATPDSGWYSFNQLIDPVSYWGDPDNSASAGYIVTNTTGIPNLVEAIKMGLATYIKHSQDSTAIQLGKMIATLEPIVGDDLLAMSSPSTPEEHHDLLNTVGVGSGDNGVLRCEDCLGVTNYGAALDDVFSVLRTLHDGSGNPLPPLNTFVTNLQAVVSALSNLGTAVLSDSSTGYSSWLTFLIAAKNLTDPIAQSLRDTVISRNQSKYLYLYNRVAESHNTSIQVFATAPLTITSTQSDNSLLVNPLNGTLNVDGGLPDSTFVYNPSGTGTGTVSGAESSVLAFVTSLPNYGIDSDGFGARAVIEPCCDINTLGGQAIVAAMSEGKNLQILASAGISTDSFAASANAQPVQDRAPGLIGGSAWSL